MARCLIVGLVGRHGVHRHYPDHSLYRRGGALRPTFIPHLGKWREEEPEGRGGQGRDDDDRERQQNGSLSISAIAAPDN